MSTIFNQAAVGQAEIALDGRFLRVNDELCRILGRSRGTLLATNVNEITHPDDLLEYSTAWEKAIKTGEATSLDERFLRPDGVVVPANSSLSLLSASGQHREVHVELAASAHQVSGDAVHLQQVFWNLFKTAGKFTRGNGEIWVRSRNENAHIIIDVVDAGIGIESDKLPDIFQNFKQADPTITRKFGGLGLGLAISKATISAHSGELKAASHGQGHGSTFTVELPVTQPSP